MKHAIKIIEAKEATEQIIEGLQNLLSQLTLSPVFLTMQDLHEMLGSSNTVLFLAVDEKEAAKIIGSLTLVVYKIPSGKAAHIEDVVVDSAYRNLGTGEQLMRQAIARAQSMGITKIDLTSHPSRAAANRLYQRLGFRLRDTNPYRLEL